MPTSWPRRTTPITPSPPDSITRIRGRPPRAAQAFHDTRIDTFLGYFAAVLKANEASDQWFVGERICFADIALFHTVAGLRYAFPEAMKDALNRHEPIAGLADRIARRPRIAAYLESERRQDFNEHGIFRHYPELDA